MTLIKVTVESTSSTMEEKVEAKSTKSKSLSWHSMNGFDVTAVLTTLTSRSHTHTYDCQKICFDLIIVSIRNNVTLCTLFNVLFIGLASAGRHRNCLHCQRLYALVTCKVFWINRYFNSTPSVKMSTQIALSRQKCKFLSLFIMHVVLHIWCTSVVRSEPNHRYTHTHTLVV